MLSEAARSHAPMSMSVPQTSTEATLNLLSGIATELGIPLIITTTTEESSTKTMSDHLSQEDLEEIRKKAEESKDRRTGSRNEPLTETVFARVGKLEGLYGVLQAECKELRHLWEQREGWEAAHEGLHDRMGTHTSPSNEEEAHAWTPSPQTRHDEDAAQYFKSGWEAGKASAFEEATNTIIQAMRKWVEDAKIEAFEQPNLPSRTSLMHYVKGIEHAIIMLTEGPGAIDMIRMRRNANAQPKLKRSLEPSKRIRKPRPLEVEDEEYEEPGFE